MDKLKDILWPIVLVGGLGAFIDFLLGRTGQQRAKDFLLEWWVKFDDIHWRNLGREEGVFAGRLIERWFGRRIWSLHRVFAALSLLILLIPMCYFRAIFSNFEIGDITCLTCVHPAELLFNLFFLIVGFSASISLTKFITFGMAYLCSAGKLRNFIVFSLMLVINYVTILLWSPISFILKEEITSYVFQYSISFGLLAGTLRLLWGVFNAALRIGYPSLPGVWADFDGNIDEFVMSAMVSFPPAFRLLLSILFVGSFLLRPLVMRPVNLVWRRIVESEKPVFTLIFGGAAAFATAIGEAAKHL
jgi:hypothetical protein